MMSKNNEEVPGIQNASNTLWPKLERAHIPKSDSTRLKLLKLKNAECHTMTSRNMAVAILRDLNSTRKRTPKFLDEIRRKLFFLYRYNSSISEFKGKFPFSKELIGLLARYIELECETHYSSDNGLPCLLKTMLHESDNEVLLKRVFLVLNKINAKYKSDIELDKSLVSKLLNELQLLDKVKEIKDMNEPIMMGNPLIRSLCPDNIDIISDDEDMNEISYVEKSSYEKACLFDDSMKCEQKRIKCEPVKEDYSTAKITKKLKTSAENIHVISSGTNKDTNVLSDYCRLGESDLNNSVTNRLSNNSVESKSCNKLIVSNNNLHAVHDVIEVDDSDDDTNSESSISKDSTNKSPRDKYDYSKPRDNQIHEISSPLLFAHTFFGVDSNRNTGLLAIGSGKASSKTQVNTFTKPVSRTDNTDSNKSDQSSSIVDSNKHVLQDDCITNTTDTAPNDIEHCFLKISAALEQFNKIPTIDTNTETDDEESQLFNERSAHEIGDLNRERCPTNAEEVRRQRYDDVLQEDCITSTTEKQVLKYIIRTYDVEQPSENSETEDDGSRHDGVAPSGINKPNSKCEPACAKATRAKQPNKKPSSTNRSENEALHSRVESESEHDENELPPTSCTSVIEHPSESSKVFFSVTDKTEMPDGKISFPMPTHDFSAKISQNVHKLGNTNPVDYFESESNRKEIDNVEKNCMQTKHPNEKFPLEPETCRKSHVRKNSTTSNDVTNQQYENFGLHSHSKLDCTVQNNVEKCLIKTANMSQLDECSKQDNNTKLLTSTTVIRPPIDNSTDSSENGKNNTVENVTDVNISQTNLLKTVETNDLHQDVGSNECQIKKNMYSSYQGHSTETSESHLKAGTIDKTEDTEQSNERKNNFAEIDRASEHGIILTHKNCDISESNLSLTNEEPIGNSVLQYHDRNCVTSEQLDEKSIANHEDCIIYKEQNVELGEDEQPTENTISQVGLQDSISKEQANDNSLVDGDHRNCITSDQPSADSEVEHESSILYVDQNEQPSENLMVNQGVICEQGDLEGCMNNEISMLEVDHEICIGYEEAIENSTFEEILQPGVNSGDLHCDGYSGNYQHVLQVSDSLAVKIGSGSSKNSTVGDVSNELQFEQPGEYSVVEVDHEECVTNEQQLGESLTVEVDHDGCFTDEQAFEQIFVNLTDDVDHEECISNEQQIDQLNESLTVVLQHEDCITNEHKIEQPTEKLTVEVDHEDVIVNLQTMQPGENLTHEVVQEGYITNEQQVEEQSENFAVVYEDDITNKQQIEQSNENITIEVDHEDIIIKQTKLLENLTDEIKQPSENSAVYGDGIINEEQIEQSSKEITIEVDHEDTIIIEQTRQPGENLADEVIQKGYITKEQQIKQPSENSAFVYSGDITNEEQIDQSNKEIAIGVTHEDTIIIEQTRQPGGKEGVVQKDYITKEQGVEHPSENSAVVYEDGITNEGQIEQPNKEITIEVDHEDTIIIEQTRQPGENLADVIQKGYITKEQQVKQPSENSVVVYEDGITNEEQIKQPNKEITKEVGHEAVIFIEQIRQRGDNLADDVVQKGYIAKKQQLDQPSENSAVIYEYGITNEEQIEQPNNEVTIKVNHEDTIIIEQPSENFTDEGCITKKRQFEKPSENFEVACEGGITKEEEIKKLNKEIAIEVGHDDSIIIEQPGENLTVEGCSKEQQFEQPSETSAVVHEDGITNEEQIESNNEVRIEVEDTIIIEQPSESLTDEGCITKKPQFEKPSENFEVAYEDGITKEEQIKKLNKEIAIDDSIIIEQPGENLTVEVCTKKQQLEQLSEFSAVVHEDGITNEEQIEQPNEEITKEVDHESAIVIEQTRKPGENFIVEVVQEGFVTKEQNVEEPSEKFAIGCEDDANEKQIEQPNEKLTVEVNHEDYFADDEQIKQISAKLSIEVDYKNTINNEQQIDQLSDNLTHEIDPENCVGKTENLIVDIDTVAEGRKHLGNHKSECRAVKETVARKLPAGFDRKVVVLLQDCMIKNSKKRSSRRTRLSKQPSENSKVCANACKNEDVDACLVESVIKKNVSGIVTSNECRPSENLSAKYIYEEQIRLSDSSTKDNIVHDKVPSLDTTEEVGHKSTKGHIFREEERPKENVTTSSTTEEKHNENDCDARKQSYVHVTTDSIEEQEYENREGSRAEILLLTANQFNEDQSNNVNKVTETTAEELQVCRDSTQSNIDIQEPVESGNNTFVGINYKNVQHEKETVTDAIKGQQPSERTAELVSEEVWPNENSPVKSDITATSIEHAPSSEKICDDMADATEKLKCHDIYEDSITNEQKQGDVIDMGQVPVDENVTLSIDVQNTVTDEVTGESVEIATVQTDVVDEGQTWIDGNVTVSDEMQNTVTDEVTVESEKIATVQTDVIDERQVRADPVTVESVVADTIDEVHQVQVDENVTVGSDMNDEEMVENIESVTEAGKQPSGGKQPEAGKQPTETEQGSISNVNDQQNDINIYNDCASDKPVSNESTASNDEHLQLKNMSQEDNSALNEQKQPNDSLIPVLASVNEELKKYENSSSGNNNRNTVTDASDTVAHIEQFVADLNEKASESLLVHLSESFTAENCDRNCLINVESIDNDAIKGDIVGFVADLKEKPSENLQVQLSESSTAENCDKNCLINVESIDNDVIKGDVVGSNEREASKTFEVDDLAKNSTTAKDSVLGGHREETEEYFDENLEEFCRPVNNDDAKAALTESRTSEILMCNVNQCVISERESITTDLGNFTVTCVARDHKEQTEDDTTEQVQVTSFCMDVRSSDCDHRSTDIGTEESHELAAEKPQTFETKCVKQIEESVVDEGIDASNHRVQESDQVIHGTEQFNDSSAKDSVRCKDRNIETGIYEIAFRNDLEVEEIDSRAEQQGTRLIDEVSYENAVPDESLKDECHAKVNEFFISSDIIQSVQSSDTAIQSVQPTEVVRIEKLSRNHESCTHFVEQNTTPVTSDYLTGTYGDVDQGATDNFPPTVQNDSSDTGKTSSSNSECNYVIAEASKTIFEEQCVETEIDVEEVTVDFEYADKPMQFYETNLHTLAEAAEICKTAEGAKCKPNDFTVNVCVQPSNQLYGRDIDFNITSEESSDSFKNNLVIVEDKNVDAHVHNDPSCVKEDTLDGMISLANSNGTDETANVISINENDECCSIGFQFLKQIEGSSEVVTEEVVAEGVAPSMQSVLREALVSPKIKQGELNIEAATESENARFDEVAGTKNKHFAVGGKSRSETIVSSKHKRIPVRTKAARKLFENQKHLEKCRVFGEKSKVVEENVLDLESGTAKKFDIKSCYVPLRILDLESLKMPAGTTGELLKEEYLDRPASKLEGRKLKRKAKLSGRPVGRPSTKEKSLNKRKKSFNTINSADKEVEVENRLRSGNLRCSDRKPVRHKRTRNEPSYTDHHSDSNLTVDELAQDLFDLISRPDDIEARPKARAKQTLSFQDDDLQTKNKSDSKTLHEHCEPQSKSGNEDPQERTESPEKDRTNETPRRKHDGESQEKSNVLQDEKREVNEPKPNPDSTQIVKVSVKEVKSKTKGENILSVREKSTAGRRKNKSPEKILKNKSHGDICTKQINAKRSASVGKSSGTTRSKRHNLFSAEERQHTRSMDKLDEISDQVDDPSKDADSKSLTSDDKRGGQPQRKLEETRTSIGCLVAQPKGANTATEATDKNLSDHTRNHQTAESEVLTVNCNKVGNSKRKTAFQTAERKLPLRGEKVGKEDSHESDSSADIKAEETKVRRNDFDMKVNLPQEVCSSTTSKRSKRNENKVSSDSREGERGTLEDVPVEDGKNINTDVLQKKSSNAYKSKSKRDEKKVSIETEPTCKESEQGNLEDLKVEDMKENKFDIQRKSSSVTMKTKTKRDEKRSSTRNDRGNKESMVEITADRDNTKRTDRRFLTRIETGSTESLPGILNEPKSTVDVEIQDCQNTITSVQIPCSATVKFKNKTSSEKHCKELVVKASHVSEIKDRRTSIVDGISHRKSKNRKIHNKTFLRSVDMDDKERAPELTSEPDNSIAIEVKVLQPRSKRSITYEKLTGSRSEVSHVGENAPDVKVEEDKATTNEDLLQKELCPTTTNFKSKRDKTRVSTRSENRSKELMLDTSHDSETFNVAMEECKNTENNSTNENTQKVLSSKTTKFRNKTDKNRGLNRDENGSNESIPEDSHESENVKVEQSKDTENNRTNEDVSLQVPPSTTTKFKTGKNRISTRRESHRNESVLEASHESRSFGGEIEPSKDTEMNSTNKDVLQKIPCSSTTKFRSRTEDRISTQSEIRSKEFIPRNSLQSENLHLPLQMCNERESDNTSECVSQKISSFTTSYRSKKDKNRLPARNEDTKELVPEVVHESENLSIKLEESKDTKNNATCISPSTRTKFRSKTEKNRVSTRSDNRSNELLEASRDLESVNDKMEASNEKLSQKIPATKLRNRTDKKSISTKSEDCNKELTSEAIPKSENLNLKIEASKNNIVNKDVLDKVPSSTSKFRNKTDRNKVSTRSENCSKELMVEASLDSKSPDVKKEEPIVTSNNDGLQEMSATKEAHNDKSVHLDDELPSEPKCSMTFELVDAKESENETKLKSGFKSTKKRGLVRKDSAKSENVESTPELVNVKKQENNSYPKQNDSVVSKDILDVGKPDKKKPKEKHLPLDENLKPEDVDCSTKTDRLEKKVAKRNSSVERDNSVTTKAGKEVKTKGGITRDFSVTSAETEIKKKGGTTIQAACFTSYTVTDEKRRGISTNVSERSDATISSEATVEPTVQLIKEAPNYTSHKDNVKVEANETSVKKNKSENKQISVQEEINIENVTNEQEDKNNDNRKASLDKDLKTKSKSKRVRFETDDEKSPTKTKQGEKIPKGCLKKVPKEKHLENTAKTDDVSQGNTDTAIEALKEIPASIDLLKRKIPSKDDLVKLEEAVNIKDRATSKAVQNATNANQKVSTLAAPALVEVLTSTTALVKREKVHNKDTGKNELSSIVSQVPENVEATKRKSTSVTKEKPLKDDSSENLDNSKPMKQQKASCGKILSPLAEVMRNIKRKKQLANVTVRKNKLIDAKTDSDRGMGKNDSVIKEKISTTEKMSTPLTDVLKNVNVPKLDRSKDQKILKNDPERTLSPTSQVLKNIDVPRPKEKSKYVSPKKDTQKQMADAAVDDKPIQNENIRASLTEANFNGLERSLCDISLNKENPEDTVDINARILKQYSSNSKKLAKPVEEEAKGNRAPKRKRSKDTCVKEDLNEGEPVQKTCAIMDKTILHVESKVKKVQGAQEKEKMVVQEITTVEKSNNEQKLEKPVRKIYKPKVRGSLSNDEFLQAVGHPEEKQLSVTVVDLPEVISTGTEISKVANKSISEKALTKKDKIVDTKNSSSVEVHTDRDKSKDAESEVKFANAKQVECKKLIGGPDRIVKDIQSTVTDGKSIELRQAPSDNILKDNERNSKDKTMLLQGKDSTVGASKLSTRRISSYKCYKGVNEKATVKTDNIEINSTEKTLDLTKQNKVIENSTVISDNFSEEKIKLKNVKVENTFMAHEMNRTELVEDRIKVEKKIHQPEVLQNAKENVSKIDNIQGAKKHEFINEIQTEIDDKYKVYSISTINSKNDDIEKKGLPEEMDKAELVLAMKVPQREIKHKSKENESKEEESIKETSYKTQLTSQTERSTTQEESSEKLTVKDIDTTADEKLADTIDPKIKTDSPRAKSQTKLEPRRKKSTPSKKVTANTFEFNLESQTDPSAPKIIVRNSYKNITVLPHYKKDQKSGGDKTQHPSSSADPEEPLGDTKSVLKRKLELEFDVDAKKSKVEFPQIEVEKLKLCLRNKLNTSKTEFSTKMKRKSINVIVDNLEGTKKRNRTNMGKTVAETNIENVRTSDECKANTPEDVLANQKSIGSVAIPKSIDKIINTDRQHNVITEKQQIRETPALKPERSDSIKSRIALEENKIPSLYMHQDIKEDNFLKQPPQTANSFTNELNSSTSKSKTAKENSTKEERFSINAILSLQLNSLEGEHQQTFYNKTDMVEIDDCSDKTATIAKDYNTLEAATVNKIFNIPHTQQTSVQCDLNTQTHKGQNDGTDLESKSIKSTDKFRHEKMPQSALISIAENAAPVADVASLVESVPGNTLPLTETTFIQSESIIKADSIVDGLPSIEIPPVVDVTRVAKSSAVTLPPVIEIIPRKRVPIVQTAVVFDTDIFETASVIKTRPANTASVIVTAPAVESTSVIKTFPLVKTSSLVAIETDTKAHHSESDKTDQGMTSLNIPLFNESPHTSKDNVETQTSKLNLEPTKTNANRYSISSLLAPDAHHDKAHELEQICVKPLPCGEDAINNVNVNCVDVPDQTTDKHGTCTDATLNTCIEGACASEDNKKPPNAVLEAAAPDPNLLSIDTNKSPTIQTLQESHEYHSDVPDASNFMTSTPNLVVPLYPRTSLDGVEHQPKTDFSSAINPERLRSNDLTDNLIQSEKKLTSVRPTQIHHSDVLKADDQYVNSPYVQLEQNELQKSLVHKHLMTSSSVPSEYNSDILHKIRSNRSTESTKPMNDMSCSDITQLSTLVDKLSEKVEELGAIEIDPQTSGSDHDYSLGDPLISTAKLKKNRKQELEPDLHNPPIDAKAIFPFSQVCNDQGPSRSLNDSCVDSGNDFELPEQDSQLEFNFNEIPEASQSLDETCKLKKNLIQDLHGLPIGSEAIDSPVDNGNTFQLTEQDGRLEYSFCEIQEEEFRDDYQLMSLEKMEQLLESNQSNTSENCDRQRSFEMKTGSNSEKCLSTECKVSSDNEYAVKSLVQIIENNNSNKSVPVTPSKSKVNILVNTPEKGPATDVVPETSPPVALPQSKTNPSALNKVGDVAALNKAAATDGKAAAANVQKVTVKRNEYEFASADNVHRSDFYSSNVKNRADIVHAKLEDFLVRRNRRMPVPTPVKRNQKLNKSVEGVAITNNISQGIKSPTPVVLVKEIQSPSTPVLPAVPCQVVGNIRAGTITKSSHQNSTQDIKCSNIPAPEVVRAIGQQVNNQNIKEGFTLNSVLRSPVPSPLSGVVYRKMPTLKSPPGIIYQKAPDSSPVEGRALKLGNIKENTEDVMVNAKNSLWITPRELKLNELLASKLPIHLQFERSQKQEAGASGKVDHNSGQMPVLTPVDQCHVKLDGKERARTAAKASDQVTASSPRTAQSTNLQERASNTVGLTKQPGNVPLNKSPCVTDKSSLESKVQNIIPLSKSQFSKRRAAISPNNKSPVQMHNPQEKSRSIEDITKDKVNSLLKGLHLFTPREDLSKKQVGQIPASSLTPPLNESKSSKTGMDKFDVIKNRQRKPTEMYQSGMLLKVEKDQIFNKTPKQRYKSEERKRKRNVPGGEDNNDGEEQSTFEVDAETLKKTDNRLSSEENDALFNRLQQEGNVNVPQDKKYPSVKRKHYGNDTEQLRKRAPPQASPSNQTRKQRNEEQDWWDKIGISAYIQPNPKVTFPQNKTGSFP